MTDLDAAIREWLRPVPTVDEWGEWMHRTHGALTAVLDLHRPVSNEAWASSTPSIVCSCSPGEDDHFDEPYPCREVRAIAEKLGVEVDRGGAPI